MPATPTRAIVLALAAADVGLEGFCQILRTAAVAAGHARTQFPPRFAHFFIVA